MSGVACQATVRILLWVSWRDEVRKLMDAQGITQEELVPLLGVKTRGAIGHYLSGRRNMKPEQFYALLKRLGVEAKDVFEPSAPSDTHRVVQAMETLPPRERRHLQAVIDSFVKSAPWDRKLDRREAG
jgi:transcriptional regulator with XRE-family HTH domain